MTEMTWTDRVVYLFVSSQQFVYQIKISETWLTNQDLVQGYYYIFESSDFVTLRLFPYYNFLLVQLTQSIDQCCLHHHLFVVYMPTQ
jgi:hypothetical protein